MLGFLLGISVFFNIFLLFGYKIWIDKCKESKKKLDDLIVELKIDPYTYKELLKKDFS